MTALKQPTRLGAAGVGCCLTEEEVDALLELAKGTSLDVSIFIMEEAPHLGVQALVTGSMDLMNQLHGDLHECGIRHPLAPRRIS